MLAARSLQVLVVSFGCLAGAQIWLEQTGCTFNMVLDPQKKVEILVFNEFNSLELDTFEDGMFSTWRKRIFCVWVWSLFLIKHGGLLQVYRSFGLGSSYAHVMRFDCMLRYSEYEANDRNFPDFPSYLLGNIYQVDITFSWSSKCEFDGMSEGNGPLQYDHRLVFQMGGDFLLDEGGKVLFSHRCKTPLDRPTVQDILQAADSTGH